MEQEEHSQKAREYLARKIGRYKRVFGTPEGEKVLQELLDEFIFDQMEDNDPNLAMRREGRKDVVMHIKAFVDSKYNPAEDV